MERVLHDVELVCSSMLLACLFVFLLHCLWGADGVFLMKFFRVRQDRAESLKLCQLFFFFLISPVACSLYWSLRALPAWHLMKQKGGAGGNRFLISESVQFERERVTECHRWSLLILTLDVITSFLPGTAWWTSRCTLKDNPNDCLTSRGTICVWSCIHAFFTFWFCPFRVFFVCVNLSLITWETGKSC